MKKKLFFIMLVCVLLIFSVSIHAKDYKVAVSQLPVTDTYVSLFKAIAEVTGNTFDIQIVPVARNIYLIENNQVDISGPGTLITDPKKLALQKCDFMSISIGSTVYVLYTNKKKPLDINELKSGNPKKYVIEANANVAEVLNFDASLTSNLEASLQKVDSGAIDGFILIQISGDQLLKKLGLKNIKRSLYSKESIAFRIQKGKKGSELDKMLTDGINKLKASGKYNQIMAALISQAEYIEWQP